MGAECETTVATSHVTWPEAVHMDARGARQFQIEERTK